VIEKQNDENHLLFSLSKSDLKFPRVYKSLEKKKSVVPVQFEAFARRTIEGEKPV